MINQRGVTLVFTAFFYTPFICFFTPKSHLFFAFMPFLSPFYQITYPPIQRKYYICKVYECEEKHKLKKS